MIKVDQLDIMGRKSKREQFEHEVKKEMEKGRMQSILKFLSDQVPSKEIDQRTPKRAKRDETVDEAVGRLIETVDLTSPENSEVRRDMEVAVADLEVIKKRHHYTFKQKQIAIAMYDRIVDKGYTQNQAVRYINHVQGYEKVSWKMVNDWKTSKVESKRGRRVDAEFEDDVLGEVIITQICENSEEVEVLANGCFNYATIQEAARDVQTWKKYERIRLTS